ncbi:Tfp pilus assembly protein FimT/FimU [Thermodesulfobacteriota bacterium]
MDLRIIVFVMAMINLKRIAAGRIKRFPSQSCRGQSLLSNQKGFTWIELIVVMMILGIVSAVVVSGFIDDDTELAAETEVIKAHLRYAQLRSMNADDVWYLQFTASTYKFYKNGDATPKLLPGGDSTTITLPSGMTIDDGALWSASDKVSFNTWGKPCTDASGIVLQAADRTLTVSTGSDNRTISITKNTGFIP